MHIHSSPNANLQPLITPCNANDPKSLTRSETPEDELQKRQVSALHPGSGGCAYLRGDVIGRAAEGARGVALKHALPAHAEVSDLDVALAVQQHVVQL